VMKVTTIGIDLAKDVFGLHGVDGKGRVAFKKRLVRSRLLEFMSQLPPCLVGDSKQFADNVDQV
jgi:transposase